MLDSCCSFASQAVSCRCFCRAGRLLDYLREEVSVREKEALFAGIVSSTAIFSEFDEDDVQVLAEFMTVLRFEQEQSVIRKGEVGH